MRFKSLPISVYINCCFHRYTHVVAMGLLCLAIDTVDPLQVYSI